MLIYFFHYFLHLQCYLLYKYLNTRKNSQISCLSRPSETLEMNIDKPKMLSHPSDRLYLVSQNTILASPYRRILTQRRLLTIKPKCAQKLSFLYFLKLSNLFFCKLRQRDNRTRCNLISAVASLEFESNTSVARLKSIVAPLDVDATDLVLC